MAASQGPAVCPLGGQRHNSRTHPHVKPRTDASEHQAPTPTEGEPRRRPRTASPALYRPSLLPSLRGGTSAPSASLRPRAPTPLVRSGGSGCRRVRFRGRGLWCRASRRALAAPCRMGCTGRLRSGGRRRSRRAAWRARAVRAPARAAAVSAADPWSPLRPQGTPPARSASLEPLWPTRGQVRSDWIASRSSENVPMPNTVVRRTLSPERSSRRSQA
jgi:hypothetical protein